MTLNLGEMKLKELPSLFDSSAPPLPTVPCRKPSFYFSTEEERVTAFCVGMHKDKQTQQNSMVDLKWSARGQRFWEGKAYCLIKELVVLSISSA